MLTGFSPEEQAVLYGVTEGTPEYLSRISAIAGDASRINEIAAKTGVETSGCSNQIASLTALGIIRRETPITEGASSRKTIYRLEDSMFLFWYRFVRPTMSDYMGRVFEDMCWQYLYHPQVYATLPFHKEADPSLYLVSFGEICNLE